MATVTLAQQTDLELASLHGCWDRVHWPEREALLKDDLTAVWEQAICFSDNGRMSLEVIGGGGSHLDENGKTTMLGIEGWSEEGTYRLVGGRIVVDFDPGETWLADHLPRATCNATITGGLLTFISCDAWRPAAVDGQNYVPVADSRFARRDRGDEARQ